MTRTRTRLGALVAAGALTLALGACSDDTDGNAADPTPTATADTAAEGTATGGTTADDDAATTPAGDAAADSTGDAAEGEEIPVADFMAMLQEPGEEKLSSYTTTIQMEADGEQLEVEGAMDLSGDTPAMQLTMEVAEVGNVDLLLVEGGMYMTMPGLVPEGKYLEAPPELTQDLADLEEIDVSEMWGTWEESAQRVVFLGEDDVDGTQMRQYEITVDEEAVDQALQSAAEELGDDAAMTSAAPQGPVVYQVWLDDDNLIRQLVMDLEDGSMQMMLDNWGEPQDIQAPAPEDIVDMNDLSGATG